MLTCFKEFEEVLCSMMQFSNVPLDNVRLCFIPFVLKDLAKKWILSLSVNSISTCYGVLQGNTSEWENS